MKYGNKYLFILFPKVFPPIDIPFRFQRDEQAGHRVAGGGVGEGAHLGQGGGLLLAAPHQRPVLQ